MKKRLKNWLLLALCAEMGTMFALTMLIAVLTGGRVMLTALVMAILSLEWLAFFFRVNADILARWIQRAVRRMVRRTARSRTAKENAGHVEAQPAGKRELKVITFPRPF